MGEFDSNGGQTLAYAVDQVDTFATDDPISQEQPTPRMVQRLAAVRALQCISV